MNSPCLCVGFSGGLLAYRHSMDGYGLFIIQGFYFAPFLVRTPEHQHLIRITVAPGLAECFVWFRRPWDQVGIGAGTQFPVKTEPVRKHKSESKKQDDDHARRVSLCAFLHGVCLRHARCECGKVHFQHGAFNMVTDHRSPVNMGEPHAFYKRSEKNKVHGPGIAQ